MRGLITAATLIVIATIANTQLKPTAAPTAKEGSQTEHKSRVSKDPAENLQVGTRAFPQKDFEKANRVFIATVPDPKLTRLALHFDRWIESLQRAAEYSGYTFDRQWIPWTVNEPQYSEPGLLLFRFLRPDDGVTRWMALLLVGESPTSGISGVQFKKALDKAGPNLKGVIGPAFSGSFYNLPDLLEGRKPLVAGGSATNASDIDTFQAAGFTYLSYVDKDDTATAALKQFLESRSVRFRTRVVLAEGDTSYGQQSQEPEAATAALSVVAATSQ